MAKSPKLDHQERMILIRGLPDLPVIGIPCTGGTEAAEPSDLEEAMKWT